MGPRAGLSLLYSQFFVKLPVPTQSFAGQTIIITGSNTGLGREAASHIVELGAAKVILAVRNPSKGEEAKKHISTHSARPDAQDLIEVWELDLSRYDSVKAFAKRAESLDRIDGVIQNAGISTHEFALAEDNESSITVNIISTYLLTLLLLPLLRSSAQRHSITPRISIVTSSVHNFTNLSAKCAPSIFAEMNVVDSKVAKMSTRYFDTKLLQVLYTRALAGVLNSSSISSTDDDASFFADRSTTTTNNNNDNNNTTKKGNSGGDDVVINMLNPGFCDSELFKDPAMAFRVQMKIMGRSAEEGSRALVDAVARGKESHGQYLSDCKVGRVSPWVRSEEGRRTQERVWREVNERLDMIVPGLVENI